MTDIYTAAGKQVLRDGQHFADATSPEAAEMIVRAMNHDHPEFICHRCYRREDGSKQGEVTF